MPQVKVGAQAPDFELNDVSGVLFKVSALRGSKNVFLVLNRGFG